MMGVSFKKFFENATGHLPYPYQELLATGEVLPDVINVPTGAGKTEAAVLCVWMWRRQNPSTRQHTPRRLVYCLPMRSLVEQTKKRVCEYIKKLKNENLKMNKSIKVITLMGGDVDKDYALYPEDDVIIVGTQDMLLSRALNRGYATSPFMWPIEFGLLNNDCLWIMDEIQLMGDGLATSVQLDKFRKDLETYGPPPKTIWMSATFNEHYLNTVDSKNTDTIQIAKLGNEDMLNTELKKRNTAKKILGTLDFEIKGKTYGNSDAEKIFEKHMHGTMTLVIVNTVTRAQSLYCQIKKVLEKKNKKVDLLSVSYTHLTLPTKRIV